MTLTAELALDRVRQRVGMLTGADDDHPVRRASATAARGGKLLRPRLLLAAAGDAATADSAVTAAAAVELLHAALLVHDDLIDDDEQRRGSPSVACAASQSASADGHDDLHSARLGLTAAVVTGDVLLVRAFSALARLSEPEHIRLRLIDVMERAAVRAAEGEFDDVRFAREPATPSTIESMLEAKTGDYSFCAPLELGAILAHRSDEAVAQLREIGRLLGVVYQLRDDVLGVFGDPKLTGKSNLSDIRAGAPTLLSATASVHPRWHTVEHHYGDPAADDRQAHEIREFFIDSGALGHVESRIRVLRESACELIDRAMVEDHASQKLHVLLEQCAERTQ